jgi:hypothetical protein
VVAAQLAAEETAALPRSLPLSSFDESYVKGRFHGP